MKATDRANLIERIKTIEGLTDQERSSLLGLLRQTPTYGLVWEDKPEAVEERLRDELPILREVPDRAIISDDPLAPNHIIIEGDNLEALTTLAYTHEGRIDVIYIDPPYNTGNKDFVYNDSFVDTEDTYRHSKWLSFMSRRLRIAKQLLSDRGVIFISIDDNEQAQLKLICDKIYGQDKFVGQVIWEKTDSPRMDVKGFTVRHDYILVYANPEFVLKRVPQEEIPEHYNKIDAQNRRYYLKPLRLMGGHKSESLYYGLTAPDGEIIYPLETNGDKGCWRWSKSKTEEESDRLAWTKGKKGWVPYFKIYADNLPDLPVQTIWFFDLVGSTRTAKRELSQVLDQNIFSYPKPVKLINFIEQISSDKKSIILDFFAGSGTTLHATMQLNAEDGGKRQCILCTNNENNICEEVTYERNKRVIQGYTKPNGEEVPGLKNNNLRYYRTDFVGRQRSLRNMHKLVDLSTDMLCIKEDLYDEQRTFAGTKVVKKIFRFFSSGEWRAESGEAMLGKSMLIIYREEYIEEIVAMIARTEVAEPIKVYVFSPSDDPATDLFEPVADKVRPTALPAAILNTYRRILPKSGEPRVESQEGIAMNETDLGGLFNQQ